MWSLWVGVKVPAAPPCTAPGTLNPEASQASPRSEKAGGWRHEGPGVSLLSHQGPGAGGGGLNLKATSGPSQPSLSQGFMIAGHLATHTWHTSALPDDTAGLCQ